MVRRRRILRLGVAYWAAIVLCLIVSSPASASIRAQVIDGRVEFTKGATIASFVQLELSFTETGAITHNRFAAGDPGYASSADLDSTLSGVQTLLKPKSINFTAGTHASDSLTINDTGVRSPRVYTRTVTGLTRDLLAINSSAPVLNVHGGSGDDRLTLPPGITLGGGELDLGAGTDMLDLSQHGAGLNLRIQNRQIDELGIVLQGRLEDLVLGAGNDQIHFPPTYFAAVYGMDGNDTITASAGGESVRIEGNAGADAIGGSVGDDVLLGGDGDDYISWHHGDGSNDTIRGGNGADRFLAECTSQDDTARATHVDQQVTVTCRQGRAGANAAREIERVWIVLGGGDDSFELAGTAGHIDVYGGPGNDTIGSGVWSTGSYRGEEGGDTLSGAARMYGQDGRDRLIGNHRASFLDGGSGSDRLEGGRGSEELQDGFGRDVILGGGGNDLMVTVGVNDGADRFVGGSGVDTLDYRARRSGIQINNLPGGSSGDRGEGDIVAPDASIENFALTNSHDAVRVSAARNITARGGRDRIEVVGDSARVNIDASLGAEGDFIRSRADRSVVRTGSGDDDVRTGAGDDQINDIGGSNNFRTGDGNDNVSTLYNRDDDVTTALLGRGNDGYTAYRGASIVSGGDGNDRFSVGGNAGHDVSGDRGNDRLELLGTLADPATPARARGGSGDDHISFLGVGGSGAHWSISAGSGDDFVNILSYGVESDVDCGAGNDSMLLDLRDPEMPASCERQTRRAER